MRPEPPEDPPDRPPQKPPAGAPQAERVRKIKEMIRKGEYDTREKIDAILDGFIKDLI